MKFMKTRDFSSHFVPSCILLGGILAMSTCPADQGLKTQVINAKFKILSIEKREGYCRPDDNSNKLVKMQPPGCVVTVRPQQKLRQDVDLVDEKIVFYTQGKFCSEKADQILKLYLSRPPAIGTMKEMSEGLECPKGKSSGVLEIFAWTRVLHLVWMRADN